jgi:NCS1 family nucleobase:cation symporter-1
MIHYTLDVLGAFIGPLFGILISDFFLVRRQRVVVDDLYTLRKTGATGTAVATTPPPWPP